MSLMLVPMQGYSTGTDTGARLPLKWQYGHTQPGTLKRAGGGDVSQAEDGEDVGADVSMQVG